MKLYKNLSEEEKIMIDNTYEFWKESSETGIKKEEWDYYYKIEEYENECGFCEVVRKINNNYCPNCFLSKKACKVNNSPYLTWENSTDIDIKKEYAKIIRDEIRKYIKGE